MKEIVEEYKCACIKYVANDGTMFEDKNECLKYEKTAECVVNMKYEKLVVTTTDEAEVFHGDSECIVELLSIKTPEDIETLSRKVNIVNNGGLLGDTVFTKAHYEIAERALKEHSLLIVRYNYEKDWMSIIGSISDCIDNLKSFEK